MNGEWHAAHRLDPRASRAERIAWHREHAAQCACRKPPDWIAELLAPEPAAGERPRTKPAVAAPSR